MWTSTPMMRCICSIWSGCFTMPSEPPSDILNNDHYARFGSIIESFARLEYLILATMAAVAGIQDDMKVIVMTKSLTYAQKRDTLYSYFKLYETSADTQREIKTLLDKANKHHPLRNTIAHAIWHPGNRPKTIRPGYLDLRQGKGKIVGFDDEDIDYTMDELGNAANELRSVINGLIRYLRDSGLSADISRKIERSNRSN